MASDQSAVAFERLAPSHACSVSEAGSGSDDRRPAAAPASDLAELASALAQIEALLTAGAEQSPDVAAALERIADIAFVLHEREVEPSLCDALDAAMREIGEASERNRASVQRAHEAAGLLRALARRLDAMIAAQAESQASPPAADLELECADEFPPPARLFDADVPEDGAFAQTVAALTQSLPERSELVPAGFAAAAADSDATPKALPHSDGEPEPAERFAGTWVQAEQHGHRAEDDRRPDEIVAATSAAVPPSDAVPLASLASAAGTETTPAIQAIDPDEDPGDLFEPMPGLRPTADAVAPLPAPPANGSQAIAPNAAANAASRLATNDPLAPIRALSEEELIALFS